MKRITALLAVTALSMIMLDFRELYSQITWTRMPDVSHRILNTCSFLDYNTGWIGGDSGLILKTTNAGMNWTEQNSGTYYNIERIYFYNSQIGYALVWNVFPDTNQFLGTVILKTTNGGNFWTKTPYPDTNYFLRDIYFLSETTGFVGGSPIVIARTTDAGNTWAKMDADTTNIGLPVFSIKFLNSQIGYASGGFRDIAGSMWRTTNGGIRWFSAIVGPEPLTDLHIINPLKVYAAGGDFEYGSSYVSTTNGGLNWVYDTLGVFGVASAIDFRTPNEGWIALGTSQKYSYTLNGGLNWNSTYTPDSVILTDIDFTDSLHGYAIGYFGTLLKYDGTTSAVGNANSDEFPDAFTLEQNYPNPFNPITRIKYAIAEEGDVQLSVYDISGKLVSVLQNSFQRPGSYSVEFNGSGHSSGIYWCTLRFTRGSSSYSKSIKLMLVK